MERESTSNQYTHVPLNQSIRAHKSTPFSTPLCMHVTPGHIRHQLLGIVHPPLPLSKSCATLPTSLNFRPLYILDYPSLRHVAHWYCTSSATPLQGMYHTHYPIFYILASQHHPIPLTKHVTLITSLDFGLSHSPLSKICPT